MLLIILLAKPLKQIYIIWLKHDVLGFHLIKCNKYAFHLGDLCVKSNI